MADKKFNDTEIIEKALEIHKKITAVFAENAHLFVKRKYQFMCYLSAMAMTLSAMAQTFDIDDLDEFLNDVSALSKFVNKQEGTTISFMSSEKLHE